MNQSRAAQMRVEAWPHQAGRVLGAVLLLLVFLYGGRTALVGARGPIRLVVYAFSAQEEAFTQGIFPAFEQAWKANTGRELIVEGVFGPSATLAREINLGAPADVAVLGNAQHVTWLKMGRQVCEKNQPIVFGCTPIVIVTRPGNPADIADFADLGRPDLRLLHADPRSSGAGEWAVLAEYGSALLASGDRRVAKEQLETIWRNVRLMSSSARATMALFELGVGDALVTYEQDARLALERGATLDIVVPPRTIVAHHIAVIVDDNVTSVERPAVRAFVDFLASEAGQTILSQYHLRTRSFGGVALPEVIRPFSVEDLGGWPRAYNDLVETLWRAEIEPGLELEPPFRLLAWGE